MFELRVNFEQILDTNYVFSADVNLVQPHIPHMIQFIEHIAMDDDHSDGVIAASCGLIG